VVVEVTEEAAAATGNMVMTRFRWIKWNTDARIWIA